MVNELEEKTVCSLSIYRSDCINLRGYNVKKIKYGNLYIKKIQKKKEEEEEEEEEEGCINVCGCVKAILKVIML